MDEWTREWPTEPGWYWTYGATDYALQRGGKPRLRMAQVRMCQNHLMVSTEAEFLYQQEWKGWWHRAAVPELPEK